MPSSVSRERNLSVHRALSSPIRTRLLEILHRDPGLDAAALADRLDLHVNTVRSHLSVLEDADLVETQVEDRDRPGRPRLQYLPAERASEVPAPDHDRGYRFLAGVLASFLHATVADSAAMSEQAGAAWGRYVVDEPPPFQQMDPVDAVERLVDLLDEFGFAPRLDERAAQSPRIVLRRCPFLDVAREHQDVVCSVHLGLMRGALQELGVDVEAADLIPWAEPEGCVTHLRIPSG